VRQDTNLLADLWLNEWKGRGRGFEPIRRGREKREIWYYPCNLTVKKKTMNWWMKILRWSSWLWNFYNRSTVTTSAQLLVKIIRRKPKVENKPGDKMYRVADRKTWGNDKFWYLKIHQERSFSSCEESKRFDDVKYISIFIVLCPLQIYPT